jgi:methylenetetrahydrofolate--tRNA-(uracil-5-)-methyltransferase
MNLDRVLRGKEPISPPPTTMLGGLCRYLKEADPRHFQPMNSNWGLVDPLERRIRDKRKKREALACRAQEDFERWVLEEAGSP